jgi:PAS domain S-box-containing protein
MGHIIGGPGGAMSELEKRVEERFGVLPNFILLAHEAPEVREKVWGFAQAAYLDNPLPSVFKERLFVHLSRFCAVRYCIARHVGFLVGLGRSAGDPNVGAQSVADVVKLLRRPFPRGPELQSRLSLCAACPAPVVEMPMADTQMEDAIFVLAAHVFLKTSDYLLCLDALARLFGPTRLQYLLLFLAFVSAAHYWTETHPEIPLEADIDKLLATQEALADCILNDPEATNITELPVLRFKADKAIGLLAAIVDSSDDAIVSKTLDGVITSWNAGAERMFGYTGGEAVGQHISLIIPADRRSEETVIIERIKKGERIEHFDTVRIRKDQTLLNILLTISPVRDGSGEIVGASKIVRDITQRKRIERELREIEDRYRTLADSLERQVQFRTQELERRNAELSDLTTLLQTREELLKTFVKHVPAAVAMLDRDMRYLQVSDRWCADYSVDSSQLLGRSHYEIFPDLPERWRQIHRRSLEGETLRAEEDRWDRAGGTTWFRWETRPWQNRDGVAGGILIFSEDITHRKRADEALSAMSRKLIEAHEQERTRIARELHDDVVQRLALLSLEFEGVQEDVPDAASELRTRIGALVNQTAEIVDDVQLLSHDLHSSKLEYLGIVEAAKNFCKEFSERQKVEIDFHSHDLPTGLPTELSLTLFRVLQEALRNAAKHSGVKSFEVRLWGSTGGVHLSISDLGAGFDTETAMKNPGLGLTSMQERLRLVHGELSINSQPRGGATIHARIPFDSSGDSARATG